MAYNRETTCVQGGWHPGDAEPRQVPIYQNTTWRYATGERMGRLFDLEESGYFYTRLANPTNDAVAAKICELEGGSAGMLTSSRLPSGLTRTRCSARPSPTRRSPCSTSRNSQRRRASTACRSSSTTRSPRPSTAVRSNGARTS